MGKEMEVFVDIRRLTLGSRANLFSYITFTFTCQILMPYFIAAKVAVTAQVKLKLGQRLTTFPHASRMEPLHSTNFLTSLHKSANHLAVLDSVPILQRSCFRNRKTVHSLRACDLGPPLLFLHRA